MEKIQRQNWPTMLEPQLCYVPNLGLYFSSEQGFPMTRLRFIALVFKIRPPGDEFKFYKYVSKPVIVTRLPASFS